jgi:hypothetical protein
MSYFSQMAALAVHNWVSAATGIEVVTALVRGLVRRSGRLIGNFWVDLVRGTLYGLLPICFLYTLLLTGVWNNERPRMSSGLPVLREVCQARRVLKNRSTGDDYPLPRGALQQPGPASRSNTCPR